MKEKFAAIVLAAGKGKRMKATDTNKVAMELAGKPMIMHTAQLLKDVDVFPIVIVVGFQKNSVINLFGHDIVFAEQRQRLGTAHAVSKGISKLPNHIEDVLILQGDDSAFYKKQLIEDLIEKHKISHAAITMLTIEVKNPTGLGRVVRDEKGRIRGVIEEKDATAKQKKIKEINPACYIMRVDFLKKYLPEVKKSPVTKEYYLTSLVDIGIKNGETIEAMKAGKIPWRGVNTRGELSEAEELIKKLKN